MIVKSRSRKTRSFRELLTYFSKPSEKGPLWLHNIPASPDDAESILREFEANAGLLRRRRNGNTLYHEILSFSSEEARLIDAAVTESATRFYLEQRAPYALAVARAHFNTSCPHVHLMISANDLESSNRLRISKRRFEVIKADLAEFVRTRFPQLVRSAGVPTLDPTGSSAPPALRRSIPETKRCRRGELRPSRKQEIRDQVSRAMATATTGQECYRRLLSEGLRLYRRGGSIGVEDTSRGLGAKRYRLKTLGLDLEFETAMRIWKSREIARDRDIDR